MLAARYTTKFLNDQWMKDHGLLGSDRDLGLVEDVLAAMAHRPVVTASAATTVSQVIDIFKGKGISQVPIVDEKGNPVAMVHEVDVLRGLQSGTVNPGSSVKTISHPVGGLIYPKARIEELFRIFETDQVGVVVDNGKIAGIVSKIDVLEFMSKQRA